MQFNFLPRKTFCLFNSNFFVLKNPKSDIPCEAVVCCVCNHLGNKGKLVGIQLSSVDCSRRQLYGFPWSHLFFINENGSTCRTLAPVLEGSGKLAVPVFSHICSPHKAKRLCNSIVQVFVPYCGTLLLPNSTTTHLFAQQPAIHFLSPVP